MKNLIGIGRDLTAPPSHTTVHTAPSDDHLHRFLIHGKQYSVAYLGGITFRDDPRRIKLSDLGLRVKEKFLYEYDFNDQWRHLIRVEAILPLEPGQFYPACIDGKRLSRT